MEHRWLEEAILCRENAESPNVALRELHRAIQVDPSLLDHVDPRRLEHLVGSVYRQLGFDVEVTRSTRDGGRDLIVLQDGDTHAIVEIKRHKRKVGVELVRQLLGVQIRDGVQHAVLIATNGFTTGARREASSDGARALGFDMDLRSALDVLKAVDVLTEPAYSAAALERDRVAFRSWRSEVGGEAPTRSNDVLSALQGPPWGEMRDAPE